MEQQNLKKIKYKQILEITKGMHFVGGAIHPECVYLIAEEIYNPRKHKNTDDIFFVGKFHIYMYMPYSFRKKGDEWAGKFYTGMKSMRTPAIIPHKNMAFTGVMYDGDVIRQKDSKQGAGSFKWDEGAVGENVRITDVAVIDDKIYACGTGAEIYKRKSNLKWENIFPEELGNSLKEDKQFWSIAGFSEKEIYAGGEDGILWLKQGKGWVQIEIPCDKDIQQIICADDGNVYLNCRSKILKGRNNKWEVLDLSYIGKDIRKIVWFKGKLHILPWGGGQVLTVCLF